jgi:hypothetical protein
MSLKNTVGEAAFQNNLEAIFFVSWKDLISWQIHIFSISLKPIY